MKGILFDLDGTLWDSCAAIAPAWSRVLGRTVTEAELRSVMGMTDREIAARLIPGQPPEEALALVELACREEAKDLWETGGRLFPAVAETLAALAEERALMIVSNCLEGYIPAFLHAHRLEACFRDWACLGQPRASKAENIRHLCRKHRLEQAIYVGDMPSDQAAAREAGLPFLHAGYGFGRVSGADGELVAFSELPQAAEALFMKTGGGDHAEL